MDCATIPSVSGVTPVLYTLLYTYTPFYTFAAYFQVPLELLYTRDICGDTREYRPRARCAKISLLCSRDNRDVAAVTVYPIFSINRNTSRMGQMGTMKIVVRAGRNHGGIAVRLYTSFRADSFSRQRREERAARLWTTVGRFLRLFPVVRLRAYRPSAAIKGICGRAGH